MHLYYGSASFHLANVFEDRKLGREGLWSREYIEENKMPSRYACYGAISYRVGSAGPMLVST